MCLSKEEKVGDDYFCPTCGKSYPQSGRCPLCAEILETIDAPGENGDDLDEELLGVIHQIPVTQDAGGGKAGINIEDDY